MISKPPASRPPFHQPLQFAAILTDGDFREIERVNLRCRIAPHIIPSPWALVLSGLRPAQLLDPSLPSPFEFTQEIAALIERWSTATWTGFNSIHFDEEMLRQAFYQWPFPPRPCRYSSSCAAQPS
jgi:exodeoxyribonuclease-1